MLRLSTGIGELDRVLGGGTVEGSLTLIGGERASENPRCSPRCPPGWRIPACGFCTCRARIRRQIKLRASRLGRLSPHFFVLPENDMEKIEEKLADVAPP